MAGGPAVIPNLQSILVNHPFRKHSIPLHLASHVPSFSGGVEVFCEVSAALPNDSLPVQLLRLSLSLSRPHVVLIVNIDNSRNVFTSSPEVGSHNLVISPSAQTSPLINHQATPLAYRRPNSFTFSYLGCQMADPNLSCFVRWLWQAHYIRPAFDSRLQCRDGPHV